MSDKVTRDGEFVPMTGDGPFPSRETLRVVAEELSVAMGGEPGSVVRVRTPGAAPSLVVRPSLAAFVIEMELKLRKNDHKTSWRELPVPALFRLLMIEIDEFKVAHEYLSVAEARKELIDIANFAMIMWDRLGMIDPTAQVRTP